MMALFRELFERPSYMYTPMLKNHVNGCHGNHAFFHSAKEFIFEDKNSLHFWGPNERFGTHEKLSWGCKVGQISSRGNIDVKPKQCECFCDQVTDPT